ncbi:site-specific DNA-methyltransferase [Entomomonas moraniae]|uniref:site-specific DNA-methyltransferase (adenine-specific) n=1 Tax=Entomomonas moraniae TaxID=2213226 RepID=A0A3Q9JJT9_9GAMM|nr:site-specific DNA-methyltransferase [Entomomonas moraniae]AZS51294.1 site-specific DNA-methyltransferase [Entomomonas moraniae]
MDKLKMHSPDLTNQNIQKIKEFFPNCVTEIQDEQGQLQQTIDFDQLKQELAHSIVEGPQERYQLNWPGKREALLAANAPIAKTLRPCPEESVAFDSTQNLFIEGDNLDALKLLQETYLGKVKMIYIDPPYNTGEDFIYKDDFAETTEEFLIRSNQKDLDNNRLVANTESNGRFHSDWLSMIYPRLKLARNLLSDDGVIFIQVDDNEINNLLTVMYEIFGEKNIVSTIVVKMSHLSGVKMSHINKKLPKIKEFIVCFSKSGNANLNKIFIPSKWEAVLSRYKSIIKNIEDNVKDWQFSSLGAELSKVDEKDQEQWLIKNANRIFRTATSTSIEHMPKDGKFYKVLSPTGLEKYVLNGEEVLFASNKLMKIENKLVPVDTIGDIWTDIGINNLHKEGGVYFSNGKKPLKLISRLISLIDIADKNSIFLDFFAGSGTLGQVIIQLNASDGGSRKFILVQLPERIAENDKKQKDAYKFCIDNNLTPNIAEIAKERIRRAGQQILVDKCHTNWSKDIGFRVLKVDSSNMNDIYYQPDQYDQANLQGLEENIKADRTPDDLLFQVLLDWGVDLTLPIKKQTIENKTIFFVDDNALIACFDKEITEDLVTQLTQFKPIRMVFRDDGFISDYVKINAEQIFKQLSPITEIKSI